MKEEKLISIIVPVYNGEEHIGACIDNLQKQSYQNIEILIINDGSIDRTKHIIDVYCRDEKRIRAIHKINEGVSTARNVGILNATGEYILFVDSDDALEENAVEKLVQHTYHQDLDMIIFGFQVSGNKNRLNDTNRLNELVNIPNSKVKKSVIQSILSTNNNLYGYIWRAIYSKNLLMENNILFPKGIKISEDYMFLLNSVKQSTHIVIDSTEYYKYCISDTSMSIKYIPTLLQDMMYVNDWMFHNIIEENSELLEKYYCSVCNTYLRYVQNTMRDKSRSLLEKNKEIRDNKKRYNFQFAINKVWYRYHNFSLKTVFGLVLFKFNLELIYESLFSLKEMKNGW